MKDNGQEAEFPAIAIGQDNSFYVSGLTKREHFAAMAMQGILAKHGNKLDNLGLTVAAYAVDCADALLLELEKTAQ